MNSTKTGTTIITTIIGLAALGFAAMSTNPQYNIPLWIIILLFVAAGSVLLFSILWLFGRRIWQLLGQIYSFIGNLRIVSEKPKFKSNEVAFEVLPINQNDAIERLLIFSRDFSSLQIFRGVAGWPIEYPVKLVNTRPIRVQIIGYKFSVLLNDKPMQVIEWNKPENLTSNGSSINFPIYIEGDKWIYLNIRVVLSLMQTLPCVSPSWGIMGELYLQGDNKVITRHVDCTKDRYTFAQNDWEDLLKNIHP